MRLWTLHPKYLDAVGLVALWREGLLARAVLRGRTIGYRQHPQLARFRAEERPVAAVNAYLGAVHAEAECRGYTFDRRKLGRSGAEASIVETRGQLDYEWEHLMDKLRRRRPDRYRELLAVRRPLPHPLFRIVAGPVAEWERGTGR